MLPVPDYELAAKGFEEAGLLMMKNDITAFGADTFFANSVFCLLAAGRATTAAEKLEEFKRLDKRFESTLDGVGCRVLVETFRGGNRNKTRDCVEGFKEVVVVAGWRSGLLDRIVERL